MADMMMNRGKYKWNFKDRIFHIIFPDYIMQYLKSLRYCQYCIDNQVFTLPYYHCLKLKNFFLFAFHYLRYKRLGLKLGFSISCKVSLGYGVVMPHYGTIVIGGSNHIGNFAVLHTSTCISDNGKRIGDGLYLATGAKLTNSLTLGNNVSIGANSLVNKSFGSNILIGGSPAKLIKPSIPWYLRDGEGYPEKVKSIEDLKDELKL